MRFSYFPGDPPRNMFDSLPRLIIILWTTVDFGVIGLVDRGAKMNIIPNEIGIELVKQLEI